MSVLMGYEFEYLKKPAPRCSGVLGEEASKVEAHM
jgi:hypothetical protein